MKYFVSVKINDNCTTNYTFSSSARFGTKQMIADAYRELRKEYPGLKKKFELELSRCMKGDKNEYQ